MPLHINPLRLRAKSFVGRNIACFNILPNELILDILELAVFDGKKTALTLAVVCKRLSQLMDFILYRTIVLSSPESIALLLRTVKSRHNSFFASFVKKLVVTYIYDSRTFMTTRRGQYACKMIVESQLVEILKACTGVRTLVVPVCPTPLTSTTISSSVSPTEIFLGSYADLALIYNKNDRRLYNKAIFSEVTHLRVGDPTDGWFSPCFILDSFGPLSCLTHLQFSRRAHANVDNDNQFVQDIRQVLQSRLELELLVVTIYPSTRCGVADALELPDSDRDCNIWIALMELSLEDDRLAVVEGSWGGWVKEWQDTSVIATGHSARDFWTSAKMRSEKLKLDATSTSDSANYP